MKSISASKLVSTFKWIAAASVAATTVACGGGGSSSSGSSTTYLTVQGTAAIGKALDGATISVNCSAGSTTATSSSTGAYSATVTNGKGPCVLTATKGTVSLNSITPGAGVANITPLTDLLTNYLATRAGTSVSNLLSNTSGTAILKDTTAISDAQGEIVNVIKTNYGVTVSTTNFLTTSIVTTTGAQSDSDKDLDLLMTSDVVTDTGVPETTVLDSVKAVGASRPYTGTTGASS
jgi:hypothetical protein